jgi:chloramphenicol 3-O-phosphotransferase
MSPGISEIITAAITAVVTLVGTLSGMGTRNRRELRRSAARVDQLESWAYRARHAERIYNDSIPADAPGFHLPDLPEWLTDASDDK